MKVVIGVDIGGSHCEVGAIDGTGAVLESISLPWDSTELTPAKAIAQITNGVQSLLVILNKTYPNDKPIIIAAGMGCPGQSVDGVLVGASNFPRFPPNTPLAAMLSASLGVPTTLLNDADAAICAEVWGNPASYPSPHVAMVTLGTGIGFALILNNALHRGAFGMIEGGHMIVCTATGSTGSAQGTQQARACGCGQTGCVEAYSSATNTAKRLEEYEKQDGHTVQLTGKDVFARYAMNDYNAVKVVEETAEHLAVMVINICRIVDPEVIVFGGGLAAAGDALLEPIRRYVAQKTWTVLETKVRLVTAMSHHAGMQGAALAAQREFATAISTSSSDSGKPAKALPLAQALPSPSAQEPSFPVGAVLAVASSVMLLAAHRTGKQSALSLLLALQLGVSVWFVWDR